jgi:hypothetical protein
MRYMSGMPEHVDGTCVGCGRTCRAGVLRVPCCDDCQRVIEAQPIQTLTEVMKTLTRSVT